MYVNTTTSQEYANDSAVRAAFPQTSFPSALSPQVLAEHGIYPVRQMPPPAHDAATQRIEAAPPAEVDGQWTQQWTIRGLTPEEVTDQAAARRARMTCSRAQGQLAMLQAGVLDAMESWVATQSRATQIEYAARGTWRRDWPLVAMGAEALGLTEAQVDELFILAATL